MERREFLKTAAAAAVAGTATTGCATMGMGMGAGGLPSRGEYVIRGAYVLSMDANIGDLPRGDVHVRGGQIVAVGANLSSAGGETIDGRDMLVLPGFVDTHFHLWTSALRAIIRNDDAPKLGYFAVTSRVRAHFAPEDCYRSARLGIAEALHSGVTTLHDWNHNIHSPAHADAGLRALEESGIRARFAYGFSPHMKNEETMDLADLARVQKLLAGAPDRLITLGICARSPGADAALMKSLRADIAGARKLGVPISFHVGPAGQITLLERDGLLGPDVQLVHPTLTTPAERKILADRRVTFSCSPVTETRRLLGGGDIQMAELLEAGIGTSLSVDHVAGLNCDFFNQMRVLHWNHSRRIGDKVPLTTRRLVQLATIDGARDLGIADRVGSLTPGKRADLIMLRTTDVNIAPVVEPTHSLVFTAQPTNVDTVLVDGRILKRGGRLTSLDEGRVAREAMDAAMAVRKRAGWP